MNLIAAVSRLRGGRIMHPRGRTFSGMLRVYGSPGRPWGAALLDRPAQYRTTVRLSKGAGTPLGWPDVLGLAVRVHDDRDGDADLLLSSTSGLPLVRHLPVPGFTFDEGRFGTLLALRTEAGHRVYLSAAGHSSSDGFRFLLSAARPFGPGRQFGVLRLGEPLPPGADVRIAYDPTVPLRRDLHTEGVVQRLRGATYRASQRGRPTG